MLPTEITFADTKTFNDYSKTLFDNFYQLKLQVDIQQARKAYNKRNYTQFGQRGINKSILKRQVALENYHAQIELNLLKFLTDCKNKLLQHRTAYCRWDSPDVALQLVRTRVKYYQNLLANAGKLYDSWLNLKSKHFWNLSCCEVIF